MDYKIKYLKYKSKYIKLKENAWSKIMNTQQFRDDIDSVMQSQGKTFDEASHIVKNNITEDEIKKKNYYRTSINDMYTLDLVPKYSFPYTEN